MTRTRTLLILGVFMLSLAVLAGIEWSAEESVQSEGQMVTGTLDKNVLPSAENSSSQSGMLPETPATSGGVFVPLDNGTLRGESGSLLDMTGNARPSAGILENPDAGTAASSSVGTEEPRPASSTSPASPLPETPPAAPASVESPAAPAAPASVQTPAATASSVSGEKKAPASAAQREPAAERTVREASAQRESAPGEFTLTAKAPRLAAGQKGASSELVIGKKVVLRVTGSDAMTAKTLLLREPDRFVVDLEGNWGIGIPRVPEGLWLEAIRVGHNPGTTRIVFDLTRKPTAASARNVDARTLEIDIR